jgi:hypothetical protein
MTLEDIVVANNIFYGAKKQVLSVGSRGMGTLFVKNARVQNNIFIQAPDFNVSSNVFSIGGQYNPSDVLVENNIIAGPKPRFGYNGATVTDVTTVGRNNSTIAPLFVDEANYNFHLQSDDTVAKGKGIDPTGYLPWPMNLDQDRDGNARVPGAWSIGPYESVGPASQNPSVPKGSGDVSGDNRITMHDAAMVLRYTMGANLSDAQKLRADINGDGTVNAADALTIARKALGL